MVAPLEVGQTCTHHPITTTYEGSSYMDSQQGQDFRALCMVGLQDVSIFLVSISLQESVE